MPNDFKIKVNQFDFSFDEAEVRAADVIRVSGNTYHLLSGHRSVQAKVLSFGHDHKIISVELDGEVFQIQIADRLDQRLEQMGYGAGAGKQLKEIKAPMPGLVLEIAVTDGQEVSVGQKLLILEAMKMENSILIQADAVIKKITVVPGQAVEKGQVLIELE